VFKNSLQCSLVQALHLGVKLGWNKSQGARLSDQFKTYKASEEPFNSPADVELESFDLAGWWRLRAGQKNDELVQIGRLLADIVPHAAGPERLFSMMGWIHSNRRNSLHSDTVKCLATIKMDAQRR
jgi:hypothetical protein